MKESLALSVLKIEAISDQLTCHIILNDNLESTLSVQDKKISENCVELPLAGVLKLLVSSAKQSVKFYVALSLSALPNEGTTWLPLYSSFSEEVIQTIPSVLPSTKVLVSVNQLSRLTPVPEITETESSIFEIETSFMRKNEAENPSKDTLDQCKKALIVLNEKNKELRMKLCEVQEKYEKLTSDFNTERVKGLAEDHEIVSNLVIQIEKYKNHAENLTAVHEDHLRQVASLQILLKQEVLQREHLEKQVARITGEFLMFAQVAESRFAAYENSLKLKSEEIELIKQGQNLAVNLSDKLDPSEQLLMAQTQLHNAIEQLHESEFNRKLLQEKIEKSSDKYSKDLQDLLSAPKVHFHSQNTEISKELKFYRKKCAELENLLDDKYVQIKTQENPEISQLKEQLKAEKALNEQLLSQIRTKSCKDIEAKHKGADDKFIEYLKVYELSEKFQRVSEGLFEYSGKKVGVAIKNGCLVCKVGNGYTGIEKFLKSYLSENETLHKRSQTAIIEKIEAKQPRARMSLITKENCEDPKNLKPGNTRFFSNKCLTPCRGSVQKRGFK